MNNPNQESNIFNFKFDEQPAQQPVQQPAQQPVQQPVQQSVQRPAQQPVQQPVQQSVQNQSVRPNINQNMNSESKFIFSNDAAPVPTQPAAAPIKPVALDDTQIPIPAPTNNKITDPNLIALTTLQGMLDKLKQTPLVAREELYENIGLWFEKTYVDDESDEGYKIINRDTYIKMLQMIIDAEKHVDIE